MVHTQDFGKHITENHDHYRNDWTSAGAGSYNKIRSELNGFSVRQLNAANVNTRVDKSVAWAGINFDKPTVEVYKNDFAKISTPSRMWWKRNEYLTDMNYNYTQSYNTQPYFWKAGLPLRLEMFAQVNSSTQIDNAIDGKFTVNVNKCLLDAVTLVSAQRAWAAGSYTQKYSLMIVGFMADLLLPQYKLEVSYNYNVRHKIGSDPSTEFDQITFSSYITLSRVKNAVTIHHLTDVEKAVAAVEERRPVKDRGKLVQRLLQCFYLNPRKR